MSRNPQQTRLISIVEPVCQASGYDLVDLRFLLDQGGWVDPSTFPALSTDWEVRWRSDWHYDPNKRRKPSWPAARLA